MNNSVLVSKVGMEFIQNTAADYAKNVEAINLAIKTIQDLPVMAYDSVLTCFSGNAYSTFSKKSHENHAVYHLNGNTWNLVIKKLRSLGSTAAAGAIQNLFSKDSFYQKEITKELICDVLASLDVEESLQLKAKIAKAKLEALNGETIEGENRFKIKKGSKEERMDLVAQFIEVSALIWNDLTKCRVHIPAISNDVIQAEIKNAVNAASQGGSFHIKNIMELKAFANGNVDIKFADNIVGRLYDLTA